jgi:hypothetical protein
MLNVPATKVWVKRKYLTNGLELDGQEEGYWHAIRFSRHKAIECSVLLRSGANFSGLPLAALSYYQPSVEISIPVAQFWSCLSDDAKVTELDFLRRMSCEVLLKDGTLQKAEYRFTIDPVGSGTLADTSDEWKCYHILALDSGPLVAYPNNRIIFRDASLTDGTAAQKNYKVNTTEYLIEESGIKNDGRWSY